MSSEHIRRYPRLASYGKVGQSCSPEDVDAAVSRAVAAGARVRMPVADMFWGDRYGKVTDPFGHEWSLGTHKEDLTPEEIRRRAEAFFAEMGKHQG